MAVKRWQLVPGRMCPKKRAYDRPCRKANIRGVGEETKDGNSP